MFRLQRRRASLTLVMEKHQQRSKLWFLVFVCCSFWIVILVFHFEVLGKDKSQQQLDAVRDSVQKLSDDAARMMQKTSNQSASTDISYSKDKSHHEVDAVRDTVEKLGEDAARMMQKTSEKRSESSDFRKAQNASDGLSNSSEFSEIPKTSSDNSKASDFRKFQKFDKDDSDKDDPPSSPPPAFMKALRLAENKSDACGGRYVYVHDLPSRFNHDMLKECRRLSLWTNMCKFTTNAGLGPPLDNSEGVFSDTGWFATNQFAVDVIFWNRMKQYECLTNDSSMASAIYVPFFAGLDISRYLWGYNISVRDATSLALMDWLVSQPQWQVNKGHDHFLVGGRITWDFRRLTDSETDWGSKLLFLPAMKNMTMLVVEASPWNRNDMAIPYPTYFHPAKDSDIIEWQTRMRNMDRSALFSFAGAPRPDNPKSIRGQILEQCRNSKLAKILECDFGESKCHSPSSIMNMFQHSVFCLQPQGDSYTRRSFFDSILAGCIPVLFHPGSAYAQYIWHLPKNYSTYSVFIPEDDIRKKNVSIEERLLHISPQQVNGMREKVINLIPSVVYADPRSKLSNFKDAFDITVESMIEKVTKLRNEILEGKEVEDYREDGEGSEQAARKWEGLRREGDQTWDEFFSKPKDEQSPPPAKLDSLRTNKVDRS